MVERLADKGKGARHTQIALDHLQVIVLGDQLQIERSVDVERLANRRRDHLYLGHGLVVDDGRRDQRRVARMHARILHVARDGQAQNLAVLGHGVDVDLFGVQYELGDDHKGGAAATEAEHSEKVERETGGARVMTTQPMFW